MGFEKVRRPILATDGQSIIEVTGDTIAQLEQLGGSNVETLNAGVPTPWTTWNQTPTPILQGKAVTGAAPDGSIVVNEAGIYQVHFNVDTVTVTTGLTVFHEIQVNAVSDPRVFARPYYPALNDNESAGGFGYIELAVGDELRLWLTASATTNFSVTDGTFGVAKVRNLPN